MATKKIEDYNDQSIVALKGPDRIRKRPAAILGSDGLEGCQHAFFEILANSVDEAKEGYGNEIKVTVYKNMIIQVEDSGRGVPMNFNEKEGRYNWDLIFCELYAGGKYHNNSGGNYQFALGLNGLGACATQCSSEFMTVKSYDGKMLSQMDFKKGYPQGDLQVRPIEKGEKKRGTIIRWKPDYDVFTDINIPKSFFCDTLKRQSITNAGISFKLYFEEENGTFSSDVYLYENGISDYISECVGEAVIVPINTLHLETKGRDREDQDEYRLKADFAFTFSNDFQMCEYYHNSSHLIHGGSPDLAVKSAFVYAIDKYIKTKNLYTKNDKKKISFPDIQDSLVIVINSFSTLASYENQTKKAVTNQFIYDAMNEFLRSQLEIYFTEHESEADKIAEQILINKRSREDAEVTRKNIKKKLMTAVDTSNRVEKFVSCRSKDPAKRELYIVEGDSALTSVKLSRDAEYQAVIPLRGKTLNCLKTTYSKIFESEIIVNLLRVIGCGVELEKGGKDSLGMFDMSRLQWSKIIICTDADEDGFQIRVLLLTMFYRLLPTLIKEGKIFIAESPLFEITCGSNTYFAYDEFEKVDILKKIGNKKCTIQRSKGLGENEPEMMALTTMNPATRRLISIKETDPKQTKEIFNILLGDDLPARKDYIRKFGHLYINDIET